MHYWQLHIGDWTKGTVHLSPLEVGCYIRLLNHYYDKEIPIPKDKRQVCRIVGATSRDEVKAVDVVLAEFFVSHPDGWYHDRANREIAKTQKKKESCATAADARWGRKRNADAMRTHMQTDMQTQSGINADRNALQDTKTKSPAAKALNLVSRPDGGAA